MPERTAPRSPRSRTSTAASARWYHRVPWVAIAISIAVLLSSGFSVQPVRDVLTGGDVAEAYLTRSAAYVALAPLSAILDTLSLISVRQHVALLLGILALFLVWRALGAVLSGARWREDLVATAVLIVAILASYAAAALLPRPMAALEADNANMLRVDFHSHTNASHDGRQTVEQNRAWHQGAGFNVAYVTDHATVSGAERGQATNPSPAGGGVTLLQAIEVTWTGEHVAVLGAQRAYTGLLTPNLRDVDLDGLRMGSMIPGREPVVIWNHPHRLDRLPAATGPGTSGVRAVEIVNGAPNDMDESRGHRAQLIELAQRHNLALTAGTDTHGWGRAAPGWTLMRIANWRAMQADALALQIEGTLRAGVGSTRVVERRVADSRRLLAASVVTVPGRMLTTLSMDERIAWLIWTWLIVAASWLLRRRRRSP